MSRWLLLASCVFTIGNCHMVNLLGNPSFESPSLDPWILSERSSMWTFVDGTPETAGVQPGPAHHGTHYLGLGPYQGQARQKALVCSQYVRVSDNHASGTSPLELSFWVLGSREDASKIAVKLDIVLEDGNILNVEFSPDNQEDDNNFVATCRTIPNYGRIRALMLHFTIVENIIKDHVYIDDVSLHYNTGSSPRCPVYTSSFPSHRQTISNYLRPSVTMDTSTITLATQLTMDRLPRLEETLHIWNGPVSASVLLLCTQDQTKCHEDIERLVLWYYSDAIISEYLHVHLVFQDFANGKDATRYPANYLRNVAMANVCTKYTLLIDADMVPSSSAEELARYVETEEMNLSNREKWAFILPLFQVKDENHPIPQTKDEVKRLIDNKTLEPFYGVSHSVVRYSTWLNTDTIYEVNYKSDMEPYFITRSDCPLMNDMFAGYGRDKCAFSKDLHHAGYSFYVLPEAFLLNKPELKGSQTMYRRSQGVHLNVFLNTLFHEQELKQPYFRVKSQYRMEDKLQHRVAFEGGVPSESCSSNDKKCNIYKQIPQHTNIDGSREDSQDFQVRKDSTLAGNTDCDMVILGIDDLFSSNTNANEKIMKNAIPQNRLDIIIRELFRLFGTYTYIEVPTSKITGSLSAILPFMHPDVIVTISNDPGETTTANKSNLWFSYNFSMNMSSGLSTVLKNHKSPSTIVIKVGTVAKRAVSFITDVLSVCRDSDIIVLDEHIADLKSLQFSIRKNNIQWRIYDISGFVVLKNPSSKGNPTLEMPHTTKLHNLKEPPKCSRDMTTTDLVLMTKNRPLQTLAFLESVALNLANVNAVWILVKSEAKRISEAYDEVFECVRKSYPTLNINIVEEGKREFGTKLLWILSQTKAKFIVLCVDEIVWVNPVDLTYASCLISVDDQIGSFQLRLGHNYKQPTGNRGQKKRFFQVAFDEEINVYYPRYLGDDFGYVPNLDGTMMRTSDVLADLRDIARDSAQPLSLETRWVWSRVHVHSRRWQLMFTRSRLVNNMVLADGQVAKATTVSNASLDLANLILSNRTKIDVQHFMETYRDKINKSHSKFAVKYTDFVC